MSFPDLPGCISAGSTLEEARAMAAEALALHLDGLEEDGAVVPAPSSANAVFGHPDAADALAVIVVEALPAPAQPPLRHDDLIKGIPRRTTVTR